MSRSAAAMVLAMLAAAGLPVAFRGVDAGSRDRDELAPGGQGYLAQCSVCHGVYGEGDGPLAASIVAEQRPAPARFTAEKVRSLGRRGVVRVLTGGVHRHPDAPMPTWGPHLGREWTNRIADFVVKLPALGASGRAAIDRYLAPVGTSGNGRRTYVTYCSSCHGPQGEGRAFFTRVAGLVPPPLEGRLLSKRNDDELAKFLAPGGRHLEQAPNVPGWLYTMSPAQRAELVAYLRGLPNSPNGN